MSRATSSPWQRKLAAAVLLGAALVLAWLAARMLLAALFSLQAETFLEDWRAQRRQPEPQAWNIARTAAQRAIDLYPVAHGEYWQRLGRVYQWRDADLPIGDPDAASSRRQAVGFHEAATRARPLRPYDWARLADAERRLGERDAALSHALRQAQALGPWRPGINRQVAITGLSAWHRLDPPAREATLQATQRAILRGDAAQIRQAMASQGLRLFVCTRLPATLPQRHLVCD
ncbi:hypothetical protein F2Q65_18745 [Thiohalocapsa marina]|uniref:Uncharacterized protein n=1 Tax=Thiohalocapsa marina TaxID=424902 RepID=A0A5M8FAV3_9GAMM|nr:hypothetical protein [Thiohalocapsa marina]KAA6181857.1 hypothetical protein F2Q65_18745 [Thiohalocapsa marina]